jgi:hypothetical protein
LAATQSDLSGMSHTTEIEKPGGSEGNRLMPSESRHEPVPIQRRKSSGMSWLSCEYGRDFVFPDKLKRVIVSNKLFAIAEQFLVQNCWIKGKSHDLLLEHCCAVIGQPCLECISDS